MNNIEEEHKKLSVLRDVGREEADRIADAVDANSEKKLGETPTSGKVHRELLRDFGMHMAKFRVPTEAMRALAASDEMSRRMNAAMGIPMDKLQNMATSTAMLVMIDFACTPAADDIKEAEPKPDDLEDLR